MTGENEIKTEYIFVTKYGLRPGQMNAIHIIIIIMKHNQKWIKTNI